MVLHYEIYGSGEKTLVLLHGMAGSLRYWQPFIDTLDLRAYRVVAVDLLGFGRSPKPSNTIYDYKTHMESVRDTLQALGIDSKYTVIGHSMGALLALRMAADYPDEVERALLCGLPYYPSLEIARRDITQSKKVWQLAYYGPTSKVLCTIWCKWLRLFSMHVAPLYLPHLPRDIAADTLLHSWQAYSQSLSNVIENQNVPLDLQKSQVPITLLYGQTDTCGEYLVGSKLLGSLKHTKLEVYPHSSHQLPIEKPQIISDWL